MDDKPPPFVIIARYVTGNGKVVMRAYGSWVNSNDVHRARKKVIAAAEGNPGLETWVTRMLPVDRA